MKVYISRKDRELRDRHEHDVRSAFVKDGMYCVVTSTEGSQVTHRYPMENVTHIEEHFER